MGLKFEEETSKVLHLKHSIVWFWNLDTPKNRSDIRGKFWIMVLGKDGDQLDRSCEIWRSVTERQGREEYRTYNRTEEGYLDWSRCVGTAFEIRLLKEREKWRGEEGEDVNSYQMTVREKEGAGNLRVSTITHSLDNSVWRRRWTGLKTDCMLMMMIRMFEIWSS